MTSSAININFCCVMLYGRHSITNCYTASVKVWHINSNKIRITHFILSDPKIILKLQSNVLIEMQTTDHTLNKVQSLKTVTHPICSSTHTSSTPSCYNYCYPYAVILPLTKQAETTHRLYLPWCP